VSARNRPFRLTLAVAGMAGMAALAIGLMPVGAASAGASAKVRVTASLTDFHIALSKKSFKPGSYTFLVKNNGGTVHALAISGPGLANKSSADVSPGMSTTLNVTLKKGTYDFFCPIPGHKALGMNLNVVVKASGGHANASATSGSTSSDGGAYS
jgi:uncharacterized cupredoxin-like copper-binding protein